MTSKFKVGDKVRVVNLTGGANAPMGGVLEVYNIGSYNNRPWIAAKSATGGQWGFYECDLELDVTPRERLTAWRDKIKAELAEAEAKIAFLDETGSGDFCEKEFKVYQALKVIKAGDGSLIEQARAIAKLVG